MSRRLRSRKGTSRRSARRNTISRLGIARPVSTKLGWRVDTSTPTDRSSWRRRRRWRHSRNWVPTVGVAEQVMGRTISRGAALAHDAAGNRLDHAAG